MYRYCEIISKSLIDFEEIKYILANENVDLIHTYVVKENVFLKNNISVFSSNYDTILKNSLRLINVNDKLFLANIKYDGNIKEISQIQVLLEQDCKEFLNQSNYKEEFTIEKNIYVFSNKLEKLIIINLIGIGWYISIVKQNSNRNELIQILNSFKIPYDEECLDVSLEKLVINKLRRQAK